MEGGFRGKITTHRCGSSLCNFCLFSVLTQRFLQIKWENRFIGARPGATMFVSLDGTDFRILEPGNFSSKWYSHKFNGPGIRYEIGLCIVTGHIVWANGGYCRNRSVASTRQAQKSAEQIPPHSYTRSHQAQRMDCLRHSPISRPG
jgi:hypothetical protein